MSSPSLDSVMATIADAGTGTAALVDALGRLDASGPPVEPRQFWSSIANDRRYSVDHRRRAVFALFHRHVHPPIRIHELAHMLDGAAWLDDGAITPIDRLGGKIPVTFTHDDTVVALGVLSPADGERLVAWTIYLRVEGRVDPSALARALRGERTESAAEATLLEYALVPPSPAAPG